MRQFTILYSGRIALGLIMSEVKKNYNVMSQEEKKTFIQQRIEELRGNSPDKIYEKVPLKIPFAIILPDNALYKKIPTYVHITELYNLNILYWTEEIQFFMTNDIKELHNRFENMGITFPHYEDFKENNNLSMPVREKMQQLRVKWSMAIYKDEVILNYFNPKYEPRIFTYPLKTTEEFFKISGSSV